MRNIDLFMKHFSWAMDGQAAINALAGYLDQIGGPCPIERTDRCPHDCEVCWKHYLESEYIENALFVFGDYCHRKGLESETMLRAMSAGYVYGEDAHDGNP